jgi:hypothetical protein
VPGVQVDNRLDQTLISDCNKFYGVGTPYRGYGLPFNLFSTIAQDQSGNAYGVDAPQVHPTTIFADCENEFVPSLVNSYSKIPILFGHGPRNTYVYKLGYVWDHAEAQWSRLSLSSFDGEEKGSWFSGVAFASVDTSILSDENKPDNHVLGYVCTYVNEQEIDVESMSVSNGTWKCGCRTKACDRGYWQLQQFELPDRGPGMPDAPDLLDK